jgi:DNA repair protein RecN (Recombination protein N)
MLTELRIKGLGVIDEAVLPLGPGLTVVTGETGAGKTMVVTGLLLLFGGRADSARVRAGADQAAVDGRVQVSHPAARQRVQDAGGALDDDTELVLRRVVSAAGRSRAYVGGAAAPVAVLAELAELLVAVHGQADQQRLVRPDAQRAALDRYAAADPAEYAAAFARWREADRDLADRVSRAAELRRETDLLEYGLAEIAVLAPQPGEAEELSRLARRLGHSETLRLAARTAHDALLGDLDDPAGESADVIQLLGTATRALAQQAGTDPDLDALAGQLLDLSSLTAELGADLAGYAEQLDTDPARLEQIEERRAALNALVRKYGDGPDPGLDAVARWADAARERLAAIDVSDDALAALRARRDDAEAHAAKLAGALSERRQTAAAQLARAVTTELAGLAMAEAEVSVEVRPRQPVAGAPVLTVHNTTVGANADGTDEIGLQLRPHPGAAALAVGRVASGGELSRLMLALEVCLLGSDQVPTLVFDEIDAGVGGRAAVEVGRRLALLACERQVLVVTHLAQVAAFADRHVVVDKPLRDGPEGQTGVVASDVRVVSGEDRIAELARMLAGSDTPTAREHAAELLADARP